MANSFEDAAQILRELKDRIDRQREERSQATAVNVFRGVTDTTLGVDTVTTSTDTTASWTWDSSDWDFDEWGE